MKADERLCPQCAEVIKKAATKCKHCGSAVAPAPKPAPASTGETAAGCLGALVFLGLIVFAFKACTSGSPADEQAKIAQSAEDRTKGFHCLSAWDGSHSGVVAKVKSQLRDPSSFEHEETRITPVNEKGYHALTMTYRAKNGFGGMNVGRAIATIRQSDCTAETVLTDN